MTIHQRTIYGPDHEAFRESVARFLTSGAVDRPDFYARAAEYGLVGLAGEDRRFAAVVLEESMAAGLPHAALTVAMHDSFAMPLLTGRCTPALATVVDDGDVRAEQAGTGWTLHGSAQFVVNGGGAEVIVVRARAGDESDLVFAVSGAGVETTPTQALLGLSGLDVANIGFDGIAVTAADRIETGLDAARARHQVALAVCAVAGARTALRTTIEYVHQRKAFGKPIADFGNTRHGLGVLSARIAVVQAFVDSCLIAEADPATSAAAKLTATELLGEAVDLGVQLHGGYGYMWEYPISRAYAAARFFRLHGGAGEHLDEVLAGCLGS